MAIYEFFRIGLTGRVEAREQHECRDNAHALARARAVSHGQDTEIWCGPVRVGRRKRDRLISFARNIPRSNPALRH